MILLSSNTNPAQNPPDIVKIDYSELDDIIYFDNKKINNYQQQQPKLHPNNIVNRLVYNGTIHPDFKRLRVLHTVRNSRNPKPATLQKWGIVAIKQSWGMEYQLLADYAPPTKTKKTTQKVSPKSQKIPKQETQQASNSKGFKSWIIYSKLQYSYNTFNPPKLNKPTTNPAELQSNFYDFVDYENLDIPVITAKQLPKYSLHGFIKAHANNSHAICNCLEQRISKDKGLLILANAKTGDIHTGNNPRCRDPSCNYCYHHDSQLDYNKSEVVQNAVNQAGYDSLLATFTAPHTDKTACHEFTDKMQQAYEDFCRQIKKVTKIKLTRNLKGVDYTISLLNGHHPHFHIAYAVNKISDDEIEQLQAVMRDTWIDCLIKVGLVNDRNKQSAINNAFMIERNDRAFPYVAKILKHEFTINDLPELKAKFENGVNTFELAYLAQNRVISDGKYSKLLNEMLTALKGINRLKYSRGFLHSLGLMVKVNDSPSTSPNAPHDTQTDTATNTAPITEKPKFEPIFTTINQYGIDFDNPQSPTLETKVIKYQRRGKYKRKRKINENQLELLLEQIINKANKPRPTPDKWRYKYEPRPKLVLLCEIDWQDWRELVKDNEHFILLEMIKQAYHNGYFEQKPDSWYQENPRPS